MPSSPVEGTYCKDQFLYIHTHQRFSAREHELAGYGKTSSQGLDQPTEGCLGCLPSYFAPLISVFHVLWALCSHNLPNNIMVKWMYFALPVMTSLPKWTSLTFPKAEISVSSKVMSPPLCFSWALQLPCIWDWPKHSFGFLVRWYGKTHMNVSDNPIA